MMPMYSRIVGLSESVSVFVNKSEPCFARKWCWRDNCVSLFADALVVTCAAQAKDQILTSACCLVTTQSPYICDGQRLLLRKEVKQEGAEISVSDIRHVRQNINVSSCAYLWRS